MADVYRIDLEAVESSNLQAIGYDPKRLILAIQFKSGDVYHYAGIDIEAFAAFYAAPSKGQHYAAQIRGHYTGEKMTGPCETCGAIGLVGLACSQCGARYTATPLPPRHMLDVDAPPSKRTTKRTICGDYVPIKRIAEHVDQVTCPKCRRQLDQHEAMEV